MSTAHEKLLDRWAALPHHRRRPFVRDGIIDPKCWRRAPRKVLLLLKEAYGEPGSKEGFDLRALIRDDWKGPRYKIWWTAAYWCYAAHHAARWLPPFPEGVAALTSAAGTLLGSAIVNIEKSGGRTQSKDEELLACARRDGELLRRQVELIAPDIVICGNTWWAVRHLWPAAVQTYDLVWQTGARRFVDFWHPANHFPNALSYYALACVMRESRFSGYRINGRASP